MSIKKIIRVISVIMCIIMITFCINIHNNSELLSNRNYYKCNVINNDSSFMNYSEPTEELVWRALLFYNIQYPEIVLSQAILETGRFKSRVCKTKNNLFGLWDSRSSNYFTFHHWSHSVKAYMTNIQYRCGKNEDYYDFLNRIGYAEDPEYVSKLKEIEDSLIIDEL